MRTFSLATRDRCICYHGPRAGSHLHALEDVQEVVHSRQALYVLEDGHQEGRGERQGAGQQDPGETRPAQVKETLKGGAPCDHQRGEVSGTV